VSAPRPVVAKLGGNALAALEQALDLAGAGSRVVVVHGGGRQITELMERRGIQPRFVGGRRFTDLPTLACVRMALAGVSDALVEAALRAGTTITALRLGEALRAECVPELGLVGRVTAIDRAPIERAWADGAVPLVAPLALDGGGRFLNVNADDVASAIAIALGASELHFLSDVPGVLDGHGDVIATVAASEPPEVGGGMRPKLENAFAALAAGVPRVRIGPGTEVVR
jgi:acetylglutamate kinase